MTPHIKSFQDFIEDNNIFEGKVLRYEDFVEKLIQESKLNNYNSNQRFLDLVLPMNEDNEIYFSMNEDFKNSLEKEICERIKEYILTDEIDEGFYSNIVSKAKEIGGNAVQAAKKVIQNIGEVIKQAIKYVAVGWNKMLQHGAKLGVKLKDKFVKTVEEKEENLKSKLKKHDLDPGGMKKDINDMKAHAEFITKGEWIKKITKKESDAKSEIDKNLKDGDVDKSDSEQALKKLESDDENESLNLVESLFEEFKDIEFLQILESYDDIEQIFEEEEKEKVTLKIGKVLSILTSGIVHFIEEILFKGLKGGIGRFTELVNKYLNGPDPTKLPTLAFISAFVIAILIEFFMEMIGEAIHVDTLVELSHAAHATSGFYWLSKGADALVPGAKTVVKFAIVGIVLWQAIEHFGHLAHEYHGGHEDKGDHKDKEEKNKD